MSKIKETLEKLFKDHRVIFWYDERQELGFDFSEIKIDSVEKVAVENNEFAIKHRIISEEPNKKFLLYFNSGRPADTENWLLDLNLAGYEFYTDQSSLILQELEWPQEFKPLVTNHYEFFKNAKRKQKLSELSNKEDTERKIKQKMLSVICKSETKLHDILLSLFVEQSKDESDKFGIIERCQLSTFLWEEVERSFIYKSDNPTLLDFLIELFRANYKFYRDQKIGLSQDSVVLVSRWMDSSKYQKYYEVLANRIEDVLKIKNEIEEIDYKNLLKANVFQIIEKKILHGLRDDILNDTINYKDAKDVIQLRKDRYWYKHYEHIYNALSYAIDFISLVKRVKLEINSLEDGYNKYTIEYYKIDFYYRKFLLEYQQAGNTPLLNNISNLIEKQYSNNYLLKLNDNWQKLVDKSSTWEIVGANYQAGFFNNYVKPYLDKGQRIFVIISDALRYEIGQELYLRILSEKRFHATIEAQYSTLPSYTGLGMAALLPHDKLSIKEGSADILCDGNSTSGTPARSKILQNYLSESTAIRSEDFLNMNSSTEGREFVKAHQLIYIYSDVIDDAGHDKDTEVKVIKAAEDEIENIIRILKHIANCNGVNVLITADHGFIYQNQKLDESEFSEIDKEGIIYKFDRRFVIGKTLTESSAVKKFKATNLGLYGDCDILITKSINRLRLQGAASRFVHGGASLQEITIPVIKFTKKRAGSVEYVDVDVIRNFSKITANQITLTFYQVDKVEEKLQARELRIGFFASDGHQLSDIQTFTFNSTEEEPKLREKKHRFSFVKDINKYNNQNILLKMEYLVPNTNQYVEYKSIAYALQISFTSDFDEF